MANEALSTEARMFALITRLHANTAQGKIQWERTSAQEVYQASFPNYAVRVSRKQGDPDVGPDYFVSVRDEQGSVIESVGDVEVDQAVPNSRAYQLMSELHAMARRRALGVDKALDSLLNELG